MTNTQMHRRSRISGLVDPRLVHPVGIAGLLQWLDFSDITTLYQTNDTSTPATTDGQTIGYVADKSGNGNYIIQATDTKRPLYKTGIKNSLSIARFDGSNDYLYRDVNLIGNADSKSIFAVFKITTVQYGGIITTKNSGYDNSPAIDINTDANLRIAVILEGSTSVIGITDDTTDFRVISGIREVTANTAYKNGVATGTNVTNTGVTNFEASTYYGTYRVSESNFFSGDLAELIIYNRAVTESEKDALHAYLISKWGIA